MQGRTRFSSRTTASTICAAAAPGAYHAEVPRRLTSSPPPLRGALDHRLDPVLRRELPQRDAAHGRRRDDGHHLVAVTAEHHRGHVLDRHAGLPGDERREAGRVEDSGHPEHALLRPGGDVLGHVAHRVERVGDDDQDRIRAGGDHLLGHGLDDLLVRRHEVVAAHARLPRETRRDHDDLGACRLVVAVRPGHVRLVAEDRGSLVDVQSLALREAFLDVDQHHVGVVAPRELLRAGRADVACPNNGDLGPHDEPPSFSMIASATLARPDRGRVVAGRLHVVGDAPPSAITSAIACSSRSAADGLVEVAKHEHARRASSPSG